MNTLELRRAVNSLNAELADQKHRFAALTQKMLNMANQLNSACEERDALLRAIEIVILKNQRRAE